MRDIEQELQSAGLYDPAAPDAEERLALLEYLTNVGATIADLQAVPPTEWPIVAFDVNLWPTRERLTIAEVAERVGVSEEFVARMWRVVGFTTPVHEGAVFVPDDVEWITLFLTASSFMGEDVVLQLGRVISTAAARIADASVSAFVSSAGPTAFEQPNGALALAQANRLGAQYFEVFGSAITTLVRHHIFELRRPAAAMTAGVDVQTLTVGFADQVDSTGLVERLAPVELAAAFAEFDATASEVVAAGGGRLVKLIGDEIMFVATDAVRAAAIALALVDVFADHPVLPPVRAALATGEVVSRDGDVYGAVVTRAARAVGEARPGEVVVDDATGSALGDGFVTTDARSVRLKGLRDPVQLSRVARAGTSESVPGLS